MTLSWPASRWWCATCHTYCPGQWSFCGGCSYPPRSGRVRSKSPARQRSSSRGGLSLARQLEDATRIAGLQEAQLQKTLLEVARLQAAIVDNETQAALLEAELVAAAASGPDASWDGYTWNWATGDWLWAPVDQSSGATADPYGGASLRQVAFMEQGPADIGDSDLAAGLVAFLAEVGANVSGPAATRAAMLAKAVQIRTNAVAAAASAVAGVAMPTTPRPALRRVLVSSSPAGAASLASTQAYPSPGATPHPLESLAVKLEVGASPTKASAVKTESPARSHATASSRGKRPAGRRSVPAIASPVRTACSKEDRRALARAAKSVKVLVERAKGVEILDGSDGSEGGDGATMDETVAEAASAPGATLAPAEVAVQVDLTGEDL